MHGDGEDNLRFDTQRSLSYAPNGGGGCHKRVFIHFSRDRFVKQKIIRLEIYLNLATLECISYESTDSKVNFNIL